MPVSKVVDASIEGSKVEKGWKLRTTAKTVAANITLLADEPPVQVLTLTGSNRDVTLPAFSAALEGLTFIVYNNSGSALSAVVKSASTTILTVAQGKCGIFICDGTEWRGLLGS
jgi:hypothetical protein